LFKNTQEVKTDRARGTDDGKMGWILHCKEWVSYRLRAGVQDSELKIVVNIAAQRLVLRRGVEELFAAPVSTSRFGLGCEEGSWKTPPGRFRVCEKIGEGMPLWAVFKGRKWTGELGDPEADEDQILTRILWLEGLEPHNANTRERFIYLHGTNAEHLVGCPASIGCVRLRNADMARLFDLVPEGVAVEIEQGHPGHENATEQAG